jgi:hypothetical protein
MCYSGWIIGSIITYLIINVGWVVLCNCGNPIAEWIVEKISPQSGPSVDWQEIV